MTIRIPTLALSLVLLGASTTHAASFCVSDGAQLKAALLVAQGNGQSDVIRMRTGFFASPGGGTFAYTPASNSGEIFNIEISGGWTPFFDNPCGQQFATDAFSTVITTGSSDRLLFMNMPISNANTTITLRRITFLGGGSDALEGGGAMILTNGGGFTGTVRIDQCAFLNNEASVAAALRVVSIGGKLRLSNSLFRENHSTSGFLALLSVTNGVGIYATNNTIIDNTTAGTTGGFRIATAGSGTRAFVANNNIWGNQGGGLDLYGDNTILRNNNIQTRTGATPAENTNNISVVPFYETGGSLNYTPVVGSPLRDGGTQPPFFLPIPTPFDDDWTVGTLDIRSHDRVQGPQIDIGAYESDGDRIFSDGFDVPDE